MVEFQRVTQSLASLIQSPSYLALIQPSLLSALNHPSPLTQWLAVEALVDDKPVALTLTELYPLNKIAQVESFVVKDAFRQKGIGRQLFAYTQQLLFEAEKMQMLEYQYEQTHSYTPIMEKILASLGWTSKPFLLRCHFDAYAFNPPWIHHSFRLSSHLSFFPWKELKPEERARIEYLYQQGRFLSYLSPLRNESEIDLETSVGLRMKGKLAGWSITRRPDPLTICYSSLYIESHLLHAGYGIPLLVESIRRQKQLPIPYALFEINLKEIDPSWWHFVKKRLMPLANRIERIKRALRIISSS